MSNFNFRTYFSETDKGELSLSIYAIQEHIRRVLSAKGNTAGFPVPYLGPESAPTTDKFALDIDTTQPFNISVFSGPNRYYSNNSLSYPRLFKNAFQP